jgi:hypothetical protein
VVITAPPQGKDGQAQQPGTRAQAPRRVVGSASQRHRRSPTHLRACLCVRASLCHRICPPARQRICAPASASVQAFVNASARPALRPCVCRAESVDCDNLITVAAGSRAGHAMLPKTALPRVRHAMLSSCGAMLPKAALPRVSHAMLSRVGSCDAHRRPPRAGLGSWHYDTPLCL